MKTVSSGYGNSGDRTEARQRALAEKKYRYIALESRGGRPGAIGGSFTFEIRGTDCFEDLLKPDVFRKIDEAIDTKTGAGFEKKDLAKEYLKSLSKKQKDALIEKVLLAALLAD